MGKRNGVAILVLLALSFVAMAIEVRYLHRETVAKKPIAWIGVGACATAAIALLLSLSRVKRARALGIGLLWCVAGCGLAGFYYHTELRPERVTILFTNEKSVASDEDEQTEATESGEKKEEDAPPPFAPLALTGLAVVGLLAVPSRGRLP